MTVSNSALNVLQSICRYNFGNFEREEFKKFLRLGLIFALIIGVYWTLRPLKDAIFIQLVDKLQLPVAKTVSVLLLLPLVMFYTKLLAKTSRERMLVLLPTIYGIATLVFSILIYAVQSGDASSSTSFFVLSRVTGYIWYVFVESFGSLLVALFWAFSADTTEPTSAKRGFPLVVAIGQMGGIVFPYTVGGLPHRMGFTTDAISVIILGLFILSIIPLVNYFLRITPKNLLASFKGSEKKADEKEPKKDKHKAGFLEGLKLLVSNKYLLGIFGANFIYEVVLTIFDFNFKIAASTQYSGVALSNYLSIYGSIVNVVSLSCLLLGISNITRYFGVRIALALMPILSIAAVIGFLSVDTLGFLFFLMVVSKAVNYALNGPALKQLYIPTTQDVKFKAQAWIETFGSRSSKQAGSLFNMLRSPLQSTFGVIAGRAHYLTLSGVVCFPLIGIWFFIAIYLGNTFKKAIDADTTVC